jgi:hypothetical protein
VTSVNDIAYDKLVELGYTGSLGEMMYAYFLDGEGTIADMLGGAAWTYWDGVDTGGGGATFYILKEDGDNILSEADALLRKE